MWYQRRGSGPALVFVHGFLSGHAYWNLQLDALSQSFEVFAFDNKGYNTLSNELGHDSIADFADDILHHLSDQGVTEFSLLGHSMGGMIAQEIALKAPMRVQKLVLFGTGPLGDLPGRFEPIDVSISKAKQYGVEETKSYTVASWFKHGEAHPQYAPGLELARVVSLETFVHGLIAMKNWSAKDRLHLIQADTLVIWGDLDRSYTWELQPYALWKGIPRASLAVMPNCSHNAHLENPALFNQLMHDFLHAS